LAIARAYKTGVFDTSTWTATGATGTVTTSVPILYGATAATSTCNLSGISAGVMGAAGFPANASVVVSVNSVSGTASGGATAAVTHLDAGTIAAATTFLTAGGASPTAITGLTVGAAYWSRVISFTAGSDYGDWESPNLEVTIPASSKFAVVVTASSAGTATAFAAELAFTE
jgi:hypothetical protein